MEIVSEVFKKHLVPKHMRDINMSVVIPIYNEEEVLPCLYERTIKTLEQLDIFYEIIFVNDCSNDNSLKIMKGFNKENSKAKIVSLARNFGHQVAIMAGLRYASGDCVIVMDGDMQDPPEVIIEMVKKWQEGFDVVYGIRRHRKEAWIKKICYKIFYFLLYKMSSIRIPRDAGDFCLMDKRVVCEMRKSCEERPFVRGIRSWIGFKQIGIEYNRPVREVGIPKYNIIGLFKLALDGMLSFSTILLKIAIIVGLIISFVSIIYALYIGISRILIALGIIHSTYLIPGWATLVCSIMFLMGLQFIFMGILGEYVGRIFMQVKGRSLFVVDEEVGFKNG